ncbi:MAG: non-ribosomal peptide synthase/polyketide synthase [Polyangiales bacterium]
MKLRVRNFVELLAERARLHPERVAIRFLDDGVETREALTYGALDAAARSVAAGLSAHCAPGDRALLLYPSGSDYVTGFFGCLYAGVVAVPAFPPEGLQAQQRPRILGIARDASPRVVLSSAEVAAGLAPALRECGAPTLLDVAALRVGASHFAADIADDHLAFLQYTSGSTAAPKGVMIGHDNLLANEAAIQSAFALTEEDVVVSWLPLFHDMGLVGCLLQPLFAGASLVLMPPQRFIERPLRWLRAIATHRGTVSGGPNFAYRMCVERIRGGDEGLDLSRWRLAFCGAEPIQPATLRAFADRFAPAGFQAAASYPCFGLAESTLLVTGGAPSSGMQTQTLSRAALQEGRAEHDPGGVELVDCGVPQVGHEVAIVDAVRGECVQDGMIGEIWVAGGSIAQGYFRNPAASAETFRMLGGKRHLRTGDLGVLRDGRLLVAGRLKDLIIVRGQNVYPPDVEQLLEEELAVAHRGRIAVFAVASEDGEGIGVAIEIATRMAKVIDPEAVCRSVCEVVARATQETPARVALCSQGALPMTSSGKLMRSACRTALERGTLAVFFEQRHGRGSIASGGGAPALDPRLDAILRECLEVDAVLPDASFFAQGGSSLRAAQVLARIERDYGVRLAPSVFYEAATLAGLGVAIDAARRQPGSTRIEIARADDAVRMRLSSGEQRMWFLAQLAPESPAYNLAASLVLEGALDLDALTEALRTLLVRHAQLRAIFAGSDGVAWREIRDDVAPRLTCLSVAQLPREARETGAADIARDEAGAPFDLARGPLVRFVLVRLHGDGEAPRHRLLVTAHHIVTDGASMDVLLDELIATYGALRRGEMPALPSASIDYADFAAWQRASLDDGSLEAQRAFWRTTLGTEPVVLELPVDAPRTAGTTPRSGALPFALSPALTARVRALATAHETTPFVVMLAAYQVLLQRYSGESRVRVGVPVAGRDALALERLVGLFVNTVVMQSDLARTPTFAALIAHARQASTDARANQALPFDAVVDDLVGERSAIHTPLFQVMFSWRPEVDEEARMVEGVRFVREEPRDEHAKFELTLHVTPRPSGFVGTWCYRADLFEAATIAQMRDDFVALLGWCTENPDAPLATDAWLPPVQHAEIVPPRLAEEGVYGWIAQAARTSPERIAVVAGETTLAYGALLRHVEALASTLSAAGVGPEARVALLVPRQAELVIGLCGVLRAGATYVPLDPKWPAARCREVLRDAGAKVIVTCAALADKAATLEVPQIVLDAEVAPAPCDVPAVRVAPAQAAYVIYTSGSTGKPKGVVVTHEGLASYVAALLDRLALPASATTLAMASTVAADLGNTVLFGALCSGRTLLLVSEADAFDPDAFAATMQRHAVDVLKIVPSHLEGLLQAAAPRDVLPRHTLILGGEATGAELVARLVALGGPRIVNHYGPTETTVGVTTHARKADAPCEALPLGAPLANSRAYVLDAALQRVPAGAHGELYIAGAGLARGYLGRPGQTAERFVPDPFGPPGSRMYRTGDSARVRRDGALAFLGRGDDQIKLRGYRIELGEIQRHLTDLPEIADARLLIDRTRAGTERLVAYLIAHDVAPEAAAVRAALVARLPEAMVPSAYVFVPSFPLTANGKLDRGALPAPEDEIRVVVAPTSAVEATLVEVWQAVLRRTDVGIRDDFFALGGDSILTLQIVARARRAGLALRAQQLFEHPTIEALARVAERDESGVRAAHREASATDDGADRFADAGLTAEELAALPLPLEALEDVFPLSPMQQGMLLHTLLEPGSGIYLMQDHYRIDSALDPACFVEAWERVVAHHPALRASFAWHGDERMVQLIHRTLPEPVAEVYDWSGLGEEEQETALAAFMEDELKRGYDLARAPLLRMRLFKLGAQRFHFVLSRHHILVDAWCRSIMLVDFFTVYRALVTGAPMTLARTPRYRDFIGWLGRQDRDALRGYWADTLAGFDEPTPLGVDRPVLKSAGTSRVIDEELHLSEAETRALNEAARRMRLTPNTLCQGAWAILLAQYSGRDDVCFGVTVAGRPAELADMQDTVGLFINTLPLRLRLPPAEQVVTRAAWLRSVQEQNFAMRQFEQLPLVDIQAIAGLPRGQSLFHTLFVYENAPLDPSLEGWGEMFKVTFGKHRTHTNYPITAVVVPGQRAKLLLSYDGRMFEAEDLRRMLAHYRALVLAIVAEPDAPVRALPIVSESLAFHEAAERGDACAIDAPHGFPGLFRARARERRGAVAVRCGDRALSYEALDALSERVGAAIAAATSEPEPRVLVLCERGVELVASFVGITKAGGAYVPLDPHHPRDRLVDIARLARARVLITNRESQPLAEAVCARLGAAAPEIRVLEDLPEPALLSLPPAQGDALAYVIYTSGSTGTPKGAMVTRAGMLNNLISKVPDLALDARDVIAQTAAQSFDISVWQMLTGLLAGAVVEVVPDAIAQDGQALLAHVEARGITVLESVPSLLGSILMQPARPLSTLRWLLPTGEALAPEIARRWLERYPAIPLVNAYGPAECADDVALHVLRAPPASDEVRVPIGRPTRNNQLYVLNARLERVAPGVTGELCVAGMGVGRGYLGDPARTTDVFVPSPFGPPGARLYRTGDLVRLRRDGLLEFVGRRDQQVKVRGYRIELGEVEARLSEQPGVREVAVLAREDGGPKRLVAYVGRPASTSAPERDETRGFVEQLKAGLAERVPEYMVPQVFLVLPELPKLPSGKIDRKRLPAPDMTEVQRPYVAPSTPMEHALAALWARALGVERVGLDDNFFELGGDSIVALQVVGRAKSAGVELMPRELFQHATLRALAAVARFVVRDEGESAPTAATPSEAAFALSGLDAEALASLPVALDALEDIYPLSPMQQGMLLHTLLEPGSGIYLMQEHFRFDTAIDPEAFEAAWTQIVARHPQLRASFRWQGGGEMLQLVHREVPSPVELLDWSALTPEAQERALAELVKDELRTGFDLRAPRSFRVRLIRFHAESYYFIKSYHHILIDGWCSSLLLVEFFARYEALTEGGTPRLSTPARYRDFIGYLCAKDRAALRAYWRETLRGFESPTPLVVDRPLRRDAGGSRVEEEVLYLETDQAARLMDAARRCRVTPNTFAQAAWAVILAQYAGVDDVLFGVTVAGRPPHLANVQETVGLFINTIPLRVTVPTGADDRTVEAWLRALLEQNATMRQYEHVALVDIQAESEVPRGRRLFDSLLVFENAPLDASLVRRKYQFQADLASHRTHTNYPLTAVVIPGARVKMFLSYDARMFAVDDVRRMLRHFRALVLAMAENPAGLVRDLPLTSDAEQAQVMAGHGALEPSVREGDFSTRFLAEVQKHAGRVAVRAGDRALDYAALRDEAARVAHGLRTAGASTESPVAVLAERGVELVASVVGILEAGAVYVPLDPRHPTERAAEIVRLARAPFLLVTAACEAQARGLCAVLAEGVRPTVLVYEALPAQVVPSASRAPSRPEQLAYVIYTSGSTGRPKGAMVTLAGMLNNQLSKIPYLDLSERDVIAQTASQCFDISVWQLLTSLLCGAQVEVVPDAVAHDGRALLAYVEARGITVLESVPSLLQTMSGEGETPRSLRALLATGEALPPELARALRARHPHVALVNAYGPAECADDVALHRVVELADDEIAVPIGRATDNTRLYVLDDALRQVAPGVVGELCVGGVGVGRGYLGDPGRTAAAFVPDPFGAPGERLYRSGDLARLRSDGALEFVGRKDQQVKVRGYRIELGEIEARLAELREVEEAVVLAREDVPGQKRLVGYVVLAEPLAEGDDDEAQRAAVEALKNGLLAKLPEYMVPQLFVLLPALPLSPNGKVDRKALPAPDLTAAQRAYIPPSTPIELALADVWAAALGVPKVGLDDNFFELGGDSIVALQVVGRARRAGLELAPRQVFQNATLRALAAVAVPLDEAERVEEAPVEVVGEGRFPLSGLRDDALERLPVPVDEIEDVYPLSPMQQGMLLHTLLEPGSGIYLMQEIYHFDRPMDPSAFDAAWRAVIARHAQLRTSYVWQGEGTMLQVVHREVPSPVEYHDWSALTPEAQEHALRALVEGELRTGFDLAQAPLLRLRLIRCRDDSYYFVESYHHILIDGWCSSLLLVEFFERYRAILANEPPALTEAPPYRDFIAWLGRRDRARALGYWKERLAGFTAPTPLGVDQPLRGDPGVSEVEEEVVYLTPAETERLSRAAARCRVTANTIAQAAWALLLQQYSGASDLLFGVTVAGRPPELAGVQDTVGLFINTIPLRLSMPEAGSGLTVSDWLSDLLALNLEMRQHEHVPLVEIQAESEVARGRRLFDSLLVFENAPLDKSLFTQKFALRAELTSQRTHTNYPLTVVVTPGAEVELRFSYDRRMFTHDDIVRMLAHYRALLMAIAARPDGLVRALPAVTGDARWYRDVEQGPVRAIDAALGYAGLFAARVRANPESTAVRAGDDVLSYQALDALSSRVASALRAAGLGAESRVAVLTARGVALVASAVGILKAGCAYVPLDPQHPTERLRDVAMRSGARVLLTTEASLPLARVVAAERADLTVCVIDDLPAASAWPPVAFHADQLAYVIYTSGSTGRPKGAMVTLGGMLNNQISKIPFLGLTDADVIAQTAAQSFDISVWQLLTALLVGGTVEVIPDEIAHDGAALLRYVDARGVTVLETVPSLLGTMLADDAPTPSRLRWLLPTGEALAPQLARQWLARHKSVPLVNAYGPAECADDVCMHVLTQPPAPDVGATPIGRPTDNTALLVLNARLQRVMPGVTGELCVGGIGVGRGYLGEPGRTAEAFVPHPEGRAGERLYRTGDLVRYTAEGLLEFVGRRDQQVKVRGYRIELGEIEARLGEQPAIREAAVLAREDVPGQRRLVAYVVLRDAAENGDAEATRTRVAALKVGLSLRLPDYMVPPVFVVLDALPKLPSGKIDRKVLPAPDLTDAQGGYVPPETATEEALAGLWRDLLHVERVGATDDFFALGGDSILALTLVGRAKAAGVPLLPRMVLRNPVLRDLARAVTGEGATPVAGTEATSEGRAIPLVPIQHWLLEQAFPNKHHWNQSVLLAVPPSVDRARLAEALAAVVAHHEAFRARFAEGPNGWTQRLGALHEGLALAHLDLRDADDPIAATRDAANRLQRSLRLEEGLLARFVLLSRSDGDRLLVVIHHLISDTVSLRILFDDLYDAYAQREAGRAVTLAPTVTTHAHWSERLVAWAKTPDLLGEYPHWHRTLAEPLPSLPSESPDGLNDVGATRTRYAYLSPHETTVLLKHASRVFRCEINDLLLTAVAQAFCAWSGHASLRVEAEGHGRVDLFDDVDLSRTVGWFTSPQIVVLTPGERGVEQAVQAVMHQRREAPRRGFGYAVTRYLTEQGPELAAFPAPQVFFNYLGQFDQLRHDPDWLQPVDEPRGDERCPDSLEDAWFGVGGAVHHGRMRLELRYCVNLHDEATADRLLAAYEARLRVIARHVEQVTQGDLGVASPSAE